MLDVMDDDPMLVCTGALSQSQYSNRRLKRVRHVVAFLETNRQQSCSRQSAELFPFSGPRGYVRRKRHRIRQATAPTCPTACGSQVSWGHCTVGVARGRAVLVGDGDGDGKG